MPESSGSAILSSASAPRRRRTKSASVSFSPSRLGGINRSRPMRSLPNGEISGERANGINFVGTISSTPSGMGGGLPRFST